MNEPFLILFDYDGVLVKKVDFAKDVEYRYGLQSGALSNFFRKHLKSCLTGKTDMIEVIASNLEKIGWIHSASELFTALYIDTQQFDDGLINYLRSEVIPNNVAYVATNQDRHRFELIKKQAIVKSLFSEVFCSCTFGVAKPDLGYFNKVHQKLGTNGKQVRKDTVLFVDDLPENVEAAESYGFRAHLYEDLKCFQVFFERIKAGIEFPEMRAGAWSLTRMKFSHARGYSAILSDPETYQFLSETGPIGESQALKKIKSNRKNFDIGRSIYWSIQDDNGIFFGFVAVHNYAEENVALSFGIHPGYRRLGIATEVLQRVLHWRGLETKKIAMSTHMENNASYLLLQKLGLHYEGIKSTAFGHRHVFTKIRRMFS